MSDASVDVPAVGRVQKKYVYMGAAVVAGIVGYAWWRNSQAPADIPAYTEADVISDGVSDTPGGAAGGSANSGGFTSDTSTTPDTDAEWAQMASELLSGEFDSGALSIALGNYLTGQPLTSDQQGMVRAAIGKLGYPPGGHYEIKTGGGSTPSALIEPKHLRLWSSPQGQRGPDFIALEWDPVPGAAHYRIYRGLGQNIGDSIDTKFYVRGLSPNTSYSFTVRAMSADQKTGPASAKLTAKTSAIAFKKPSAPRISGIGKTSATTTTAAVPGATGYLWYINHVAHGHSDKPTYQFQGLRPGTTYKASVKPDNFSQGPGPESSQTSFKTKK